MRVLFTISNYPLSRMIRSLTHEPFSHVALECDGVVIHATPSGVQMVPLADFLTHSKIIDVVYIPTDYQRVLQLYARYQNASYDWPGLMYIGLRYIFRELPKVNLWQHTGMFICTEWVTEYLYSKQDSLITPGGIRDILLQRSI